MSTSGLSVGTMKLAKLSDDEKLVKIAIILKDAQKPLIDKVFNLLVAIEQEEQKVDGFLLRVANEIRQVYKDKRGMYHLPSPKSKKAYLDAPNATETIKKQKKEFEKKVEEELERKKLKLQQSVNIKKESSIVSPVGSIVGIITDDDVSELESTTYSQHARDLNTELDNAIEEAILPSTSNLVAELDTVFNHVSLEDERKPSAEELTVMEAETNNPFDNL